MGKGFALLLVILFLATLCLIVDKPASGVSAVENSWATKASMPTNRTGLGVAVVNNKIYAIGGYNGGNYLNVNEEYDPATNTWASKKPMPTGRYIFGIAVYQNKIYVIGGGTVFGQNGEGVIHSGVNEVYDPSTDTWESRTSMPTKRGQMDANMVDGKIYVIGGRTAGQYSTTNLTEVYDPSTDTWTTKAAIPYPVVSYQSAVVGKRIYIIGGQDEFDSRLNLDITQIYDTVSNTWSLGAATPTFLWEGAAAATAGVKAPKRIYVMGVSERFAVPSKQNYIYDPQANSWSTGAPLPTARYSPAIAVVNDLLYVIGGATGWKTLGAAEEYTPFGYGTTTPEETAPPNVTVISPENKTYSMSNVSLVFAMTNRPAVWMGYSLDGQETVTLTGNITLTGLVETAHNVIVYASDIVGDTGASERVFFVIGVPPVVSVVSPSNKTYELSNVTLTFTVNESVSWTGYSLDGLENSTISGNMTLAGLSGGSHRLRVYANDTAGNMGVSETVNFKITEPFPTSTILAASFAVVAVVLTIVVLLFRRKQRKTANLQQVKKP